MLKVSESPLSLILDFLQKCVKAYHVINNIYKFTRNAWRRIDFLFIKYKLKMSKTKLKLNDTDKVRKKQKTCDVPEILTNEIQSINNDKPATIKDTNMLKASAPKKNNSINTVWADSFAKILSESKPKHKKSVVLSKAKKNDEIVAEKQKNVGFEIDGEIKEEETKPDDIELNVATEKYENSIRRNKKLELRVRPMQMDYDREKSLKKITTKGVVQLFNAVRAQQKDLHRKLDEVGSLDHKRDAVLNNINKKKFLDVLMGGAKANSEMVGNEVKDEVKEEDDSDDNDNEYVNGPAKKLQWDVLRFVLKLSCLVLNSIKTP